MCESKKEKDIKLIERCVTEKWDLRAMGCFDESLDEVESCPLCQEYWGFNLLCKGCPVRARTGRANCHGSPFDDWCAAELYGDEDYAPIEQEIEFLISLLPEDHPWRNI